MRNVAIIFSLFLFLSFSSAKAAQDVVAKVNNKIITSFEVNDRYRFVIMASGINIKSADDQKILRSQIIDKMIDEELIRQEAQNLKMTVSEAELKDTLEIVALQRKQNPTQFKLFFVNKKLSFDNYLKQLETEILWSKITSEVLRSKVKITDVEVSEFFEQHKFDSDVRKFLLSEILIAPAENSAQLANKLLGELRAGADFKTIVKQFSSAISSENNGEIGLVAQGDIDKRIYEAIVKLPKGGYSNVVLLDDGYHIFKLLDVKVESHVSDKDLSAAKNAMFNLKLQNLSKGYLMDLRKKAFIEKS
jgi:parvulin-like peptidyl-prolyl isomerase